MKKKVKREKCFVSEGFILRKGIDEEEEEEEFK